MATTPFFTRLEDRCRQANTLLCVGLDPHRSELKCAPEASNAELALAAESFCMRLINETHEFACAFKPNAAFFEALGKDGFAALERVMAAIPKTCLTVYDCKRGDISTTAEAYADSAYKVLNADSVTLHPYMGWDSIEPFVRDKSKGVFVLVKTSNPSSQELQQVLTANKATEMFEFVAQRCQQWGEKTIGATNNIGMVVGATDINALQKTRAKAPQLWILAPGVGFQGGDLERAVAAGLRKSDGLGLLLPVSRGISRAADPKKAAKELRDQINAVRTKVMSSEEGSEQAKRQKVEILPHQVKFFNLAIRCGVLKFGSFKLKSGRMSPYFFNAGLFNTGSAQAELASCYAQTVIDSGIEFDVLFGPAYKGIPLAASVAAALFTEHGKDVPFCYNRKEEKDHGEGGTLVGAEVKAGTRVLILDDVITAGTAVRESVKLISKVGGSVVGLVVAIDRQEVVVEGDTKSAVESVKHEFGFKVNPIVTLSDLLVFCSDQVSKVGGEQILTDIKEYRSKYGVVSSSST